MEPTKEINDIFRYADETGIPHEEMNKMLFERDYYKKIRKERKISKICCWTAMARKKTLGVRECQPAQ